MLILRLSKDSRDFISTREPKHQRQLAAKIQMLRDDPLPTDSKILENTKPVYRRADIGEYRIVYRVDGDSLYVSIIGKRNDDEVYRRMKKK